MIKSAAGVFVPLTTPFDPITGEIAAIALRNNARALLEMGVTGLLAAGSTGEAPMLTDDEVRQCIGWLRDVVPDDRFLMVGTGRESTSQTIQASIVAAGEGADAVLVRAPSYFSGSLRMHDLRDHYLAVADESPVPVYVYNIPKYTHLPLPDSLFASLISHGNIAGAKDSSGDLKNLAAYMSAAPGWTMLVGSGALLYPALEMGAAGGIVAVGNFAAETAVAILRAFESGDKAAAGAAQERLGPLHHGIVGKLGPAGVKLAMDQVGLVGGPPRPPLGEVNAEGRAAVTTLLQRSALIGA